MWKKVICWALVTVWLVVIFYFSAQNGAGSNYQSRAFIENMAKSGVKIARDLGIMKEEPTKEQYNRFVDKMNGFTRKMAHGTIYFVLAILIMMALSISKNVTYTSVLITVIICFIYSLTDEYHQMFVPARTGLLIDCVIDTFGAILGSSIYVLVWKILHGKKDKKEIKEDA